MQIGFVTELFTEAKRRGIHTCLDTSGITFRPDQKEAVAKMDRLMKVTDLILLDIKHIDPGEHKKLCGQENARILAYARYLDQKQIPVWIRHVVVPGFTDRKDDLYQLGRFIGTLHNVKALEVLPYHDLGKIKYEKLGWDYPLKDTKPLSKEAAEEARKMILHGMHDKQVEADNASRKVIPQHP
jgi:pyruvate formate lyase activating enzyme